MTKNTITHAETVGRNIEHNAQRNAQTYRDMLAQADRWEERGDMAQARQCRKNAKEYYSTRLGDRGRAIVDAGQPTA